MLLNPNNNINNKTNNFFNQIISDFKKISRETKETLFPSKRYIIPRDWFDYIMNNPRVTNMPVIYNAQFLSSSLKHLKNDIDERKIVLLIFELMKHIQKTFSVDYIIQVNISVDKDNIISFKDIQVFNNNEFNETNVSLNQIITPVNETYLKYPRFQILNNNKISEISSNKILSNGDREHLSKTDKDTISIISNTQYSFKENMSTTSFNLDSYKKISLAPLGLKNPSIYCYMNCILQILLSIPELNYYFLYKKYKQDQNHKTLICDDYSNFISLYQYFLNHKETKMDLPPYMLDICNSLLPRGIMNDCEEFLMLLLKSIQEELNHNYNNKNKNGNINNIDDKDIQKKWCLYREANSSFTDSIFTGYICSTVICNKCNKSSYNYEPFMELSVPIPNTDKSIKKCLDIYFEVELIDCNYNCDICKSNTSVSTIYI